MDFLNKLESLLYSPFFLGLFAIAALMLLVLWVLNTYQKSPKAFLGADISKSLKAVAGFAVIFSPIWLILLVGDLWLLLEIFFSLKQSITNSAVSTDTSPDSDNLRWNALAFVGLLTALGGLLATPLALLSVFTTERQTKTAEALKQHQDLVLLNSRIQDALILLSARSQELRMGRTVFYTNDSGRQSLHQWQDDPEEIPKEAQNIEAQAWSGFENSLPDVQARLSGIGSLAAIAKEHPDQRRAINEHLASFIRANAPASTAKEPPFDFGIDWENHSEVQEIRQSMRSWTKSLTVHPEIQEAITLIGKSSKTTDTTNLNLQKSNLQNVNLSRGFFERVDLTGSRMEGAVLFGTKLMGATLRVAKLQGANVQQAHLSEAALQGVHFQTSDLTNSILKDAFLEYAQMQGAYLCGAQMQAATLLSAKLHGANFFRAEMQGADLRSVELQGAELKEAQMQETDLIGVAFSPKTNFYETNISGAALKSNDFTNTNLTQSQINNAFGDASVILPGTLAPPHHWPDREIDWSRFMGNWKDWLANPKTYLPPQNRTAPDAS